LNLFAVVNNVGTTSTRPDAATFVFI